jgi:hypothetical protein
MCHEMSTVAFDLLVGGDGQENDFGEFAAIEGSNGSPSYYFQRFLDNGYRDMTSIINQSSYVVFGHLGELFLEYAFQAGENDHTFTLVVIVDHPELDVSISFFQYCWLS